MLNKLNYYSRYNRIKQEDQKHIASLYTLVSHKTLTKLANDATISLQMINLYRKKSRFNLKTSFNQNEEEDQQYLQANINKLYFQQNIDGQIDPNEAQNTKVQKKFKSSLQKSINSLRNSTQKQKRQGKYTPRQMQKSPRTTQPNLRSTQKNPKKNYNKSIRLQNLVRQIREQSRQRLVPNQRMLEQQKKRATQNRKQTLAKGKDQKNKRHNVQKQSINQDLLLISHQEGTDLVDFIETPNQQYNWQVKQENYFESKLLNKTIKSLLVQKPQGKTQNGLKYQKGQNQIGLKRENQKSSHNQSVNNGSKEEEYVESVEDQNQDHSRPSVVIGRLNFQKQKENVNMKDLIKQCINKQHLQYSSRQDNASSKSDQLSEIKNYEKQQIKPHKPYKNLIDLELNHSQSQILKPQERNLDAISPPCEVSNQNDIVAKNYEHKPADTLLILDILNFPTSQDHQNQKIKDSSSLVKMEQRQKQVSGKSNPLSNRTLSKPDSLKEELQDKVIDKVEQIDENYPMTTSYKTINNLAPANFLSQINNRKPIEEPPYQHPLEAECEKNKQDIIQSKFKAQEVNFQPQSHPVNYKKQSFKKFMMNKQLNPRLVTSTILNEKNSNNRASRQLLKDSLRQQPGEYKKSAFQGQSGEYRNSAELVGQNRHIQMKKDSKGNYPPHLQQEGLKKPKKNFKKMMNKKQEVHENTEINRLPDESTPLKKLQNKKLLQAFFNEN